MSATEQDRNLALARRCVDDVLVADINDDRPWLVAPAYPDGIGRTGRA